MKSLATLYTYIFACVFIFSIIAPINALEVLATKAGTHLASAVITRTVVSTEDIVKGAAGIASVALIGWASKKAYQFIMNCIDKRMLIVQAQGQKNHEVVTTLLQDASEDIKTLQDTTSEIALQVENLDEDVQDGFNALENKTQEIQDTVISIQEKIDINNLDSQAHFEEIKKKLANQEQISSQDRIFFNNFQDELGRMNTTVHNLSDQSEFIKKQLTEQLAASAANNQVLEHNTNSLERTSQSLIDAHGKLNQISTTIHETSEQYEAIKKIIASKSASDERANTQIAAVDKKVDALILLVSSLFDEQAKNNPHLSLIVSNLIAQPNQQPTSVNVTQ